MVKNVLDEYNKVVEQYANQIKLNESIITSHKGLVGVRDKIVLWKTAWIVEIQWAALPKEAVLWLALAPLAIATFNELLKFLGASFAIPLDYGSVIGVSFVAGLVVFGVWCYTKLGTKRRDFEISAKQNLPTSYSSQK